MSANPEGFSWNKIKCPIIYLLLPRLPIILNCSWRLPFRTKTMFPYLIRVINTSPSNWSLLRLRLSQLFAEECIMMMCLYVFVMYRSWLCDWNETDFCNAIAVVSACQTDFLPCLVHINKYGELIRTTTACLPLWLFSLHIVVHLKNRKCQVRIVFLHCSVSKELIPSGNSIVSSSLLGKDQFYCVGRRPRAYTLPPHPGINSSSVTHHRITGKYIYLHRILMIRWPRPVYDW